MRIHITQSPRGHKILRLMHELGDMPEYQLNLELMALSNSIFIFEKNYSELRDYIVTLTTDPRLEHLFIPENREQLHAVSLDVVRRLHNFVAASMSLRDHALTMYNRYYKDSNRFPEYEEKVRQVFGQDPLAQFVMGLRKYCQHYQSPNLGYQTRVSDTDGTMNRSAILFVKDLLSFDGWNTFARAYIDTCQIVVDMLDVTTRYKDKVLEFYGWFQARQSEIHSAELRRFRDKEAELFLLQIEDKVDLCLMHKDDMPYRGEEIFSTVFMRGQFDELSKIPSGSPKRGERAIELLQQHFPVPDELAQKIQQLYKEPGFFQPRTLPGPLK